MFCSRLRHGDRRFSAAAKHPARAADAIRRRQMSRSASHSRLATRDPLIRAASSLWEHPGASTATTSTRAPRPASDGGVFDGLELAQLGHLRAVAAKADKS